MLEDNRGVLHAIEIGGFHHRVLGHVEEDETVSSLERAMKTVVANHIAREAGGAAQAIGMRAGLRGGDSV